MEFRRAASESEELVDEAERCRCGPAESASVRKVARLSRQRSHLESRLHLQFLNLPLVLLLRLCSLFLQLGDSLPHRCFGLVTSGFHLQYASSVRMPANRSMATYRLLMPSDGRDLAPCGVQVVSHFLAPRFDLVLFPRKLVPRISHK